MKNFHGDEEIPWEDHVDEISRIVIENSVKCIGQNTFRNMKKLISVEFVHFEKW